MVYTAAGVAVMWCVFLALHLVMPEKVPFDYTVILGFFSAEAGVNLHIKRLQKSFRNGQVNSIVIDN